MSEDSRDTPLEPSEASRSGDAEPAQTGQVTAGRPQSGQSKSAKDMSAKDKAKDRLAAALRENLKRRKAQIVARRGGETSD